MSQLLVVTVAAIAIAACDDEPAASDPALSDPEGQPPADEPPGAEDPCTGEGACAGEGVCDVYECGGQAAAFNHFGCPRVACNDDGDCPSGEGCFVRAYAADCLPSSVTCADEGGTCGCTVTDDCGGVTQAHCLPTEFYPKESYCPVTLSCEELPTRRDAIAGAQLHHAGADHEDLATDLEACLIELDAIAADCP